MIYLKKSRQQSTVIFLHGSAGCGLTHLLCAACRVSIKAAYLNMNEIMQKSQKQRLEGLETCDLVAIDDVHAVSSNKELQQEIFHLFNHVRGQGGSLIIASHKRLEDMEFCFPDISSRFSSGVNIRIQQLHNDDLPRAIQLRLNSRKISLDNKALDFMRLRLPQDVSIVMRSIDRICNHSVDGNRTKKITIPLIKEILDL